MRWRNYTNLRDAQLRRIYAKVRPSGLPAHDLMVFDCLNGVGYGTAYTRAPHRIFVAVPRTERSAQRAWHCGFKPKGRIETFVHIVAHELRHLWQATNHRPLCERDANLFAARIVKRFRNGEI